MIFEDRQDGGKKLAKSLKRFKSNNDVIILGLPRGGVVTAFEIANELNLPMDLVVPRKIGAPDNPEFAIGAITEDGKGVFDADVISSYSISEDYIKREVEKEKKEASRRLKTYRQDRDPLILKDKIVILVDDGVATGSTMIAAIESVKNKEAKKIIVAVPVTSRSALRKIEEMVDEVIYLDAPLFFGAVGAFYEVFDQTEDDEVIELMEKSENIYKN